MKIASRCDYAVRALIQLAMCGDKSARQTTATIGKAQNIPNRYMGQILNQLMKAGIVEAKRGKAGWHRLAKPVEEISLGDVMRLVDGPNLGLPRNYDKGASTAEVWGDLQNQVACYVDNTTLKQICQEVRLTRNRETASL